MSESCVLGAASANGAVSAVSAVGAVGPDSAVFDEGARLLKAMAHPLRLALLAALAKGPHCVHELVDATGASQPLVSQHLRVLRSVELLQTERRGREVAYSLADDHVAHIVVDALEHASKEGAHHDRHVHEPR
ncbi:MAG: ArsR/SmtB family transcription factor [Acidimicrobiales bacterium]